MNRIKALRLAAQQADSLIKEAEKYKAEVDALPIDHPARAIYKSVILNTLSASLLISKAVIEDFRPWWKKMLGIK